MATPQQRERAARRAQVAAPWWVGGHLFEEIPPAALW